MTRTLSEHHVNILSASVNTSTSRLAISKFVFEMANATHLDHVLNAVRRIGEVAAEQISQVLQDAGFGTSISRVENARPAGTFLGISPRGNAPQFSTIRLTVSSGPPPPPKVEPVSPPAQTAPEGQGAPAENTQGPG